MPAPPVPNQRQLPPTTSADLQTDQIEIAGIALTMDEAAIRARVGEPQTVTEQATGCCGLVRQLAYPTLVVGLVEGLEPGRMTVYALTTTSPGVATDQGVAVGDGRQRVLEVYGPPQDEVLEGDRTILYYPVTYDSDRLSFVIKADQIVEISYYSLLN